MTSLPGSAWTLGVTFFPGDGANTVPSEVTLTVEKPDGTQDVFDDGDFTTVAEDQYAYTYVPATAGTYIVQWASAGTVDHVVEKVFTVVASKLAAP